MQANTAIVQAEANSNIVIVQTNTIQANTAQAITPIVQANSNIVIVASVRDTVAPLLLINNSC